MFHFIIRKIEGVPSPPLICEEEGQIMLLRERLLGVNEEIIKQELARVSLSFRHPVELIGLDRPVEDFDAHGIHREMLDRGVFVRFRLKDRPQLLKIGPQRPPPLPPRLPLILLMLLIISTIITTTLIMVPLTKRIKRLKVFSERLQAGAFDHRIEDRSKDALGDLSRSFNQMAARLSEVLKSQEELLQAVAHEVNHPVSRVRLGLALLPESTQPERAEKRISAILEDLDEIETLSEELVHLLEANGASLHFEAIPIEGIIEQLITAVSEEYETPIRLNVAEGITPRVLAAPRHFQRAIENLLRNAARYAEVEVRVRISEDEARRVVVEVEDDGPGIPEEERLRVTRPFTRLEASRDRQTGGIGLGLAIVSRILSRHEGVLEIEAGPKGGALMRTRWQPPIARV